jgi:gliding motility-associated-like protein
VKLTVENGDCEVSDLHQIEVVDKPNISISSNFSINFNQEYIISENSPLTLDFSSNSDQITFTLSCTLVDGRTGNIPSGAAGDSFTGRWILEGEKPARLDCQVQADNTQSTDCTATRNFSIIINKLLSIPDLLTPNGDARNETWNIGFFDPERNKEDFNIELYDRLGNCIKGCNERFTVADAIDWNADDCPAGPTWYLIKGPNGFKRTGALTIVKN